MSSTHNEGRAGTPPSEIKIDSELVHGLLKDQHSDLAHLPIYFEQEGWDNVMFRLGTDLVIRLPRRQAAADLIINEQKWLPSLAVRLPVAVPLPYRVGLPSINYPWRWSILPWFSGVPADMEAPSPSQTIVFAAFLKALHTTAPIDAPSNPVRGVPLQQRAPIIEKRLQRLEITTNFITKKIRQLWNRSIHTPIDLTPTWIHGDLHARNVLVHEGSISAIIDWGDITSGDPATDLASIWMLFSDQGSREVLMSSLDFSDATWQRARGWAILFAAILLDTGLVNDRRNAELGRKTLERILEDE